MAADLPSPSMRKVRLHCPSASLTVAFEAEEEQRLHIGSIAATFGLEPASVRLNGHFISRGADLISSSVTWRSLLRFFSSKGLSTGRDGGGPLIVDGKLLNVGSKRSQDSQGSSVNGIGFGGNLPHSKKLKNHGSGYSGSHVGFKRKDLLEGVKTELSKRLKLNDIPSVFCGRNDTSTPTGWQSCGYINDSMKRQREDDTIAGAPVKRVR